MKVEFYHHSLDERDIANVTKVLRSVFLTTGPVVSDFEHRFSEFIKLPYVVALNSCTAALHLALAGLGIGPGDEVITTSLTFIASATSIMHCGAKPVLVDVDPLTGCIDPAAVEAAITCKTKAVIPVHLYGTMCDMRALRVIADRYNLFLVEDCAHCIEGLRDGISPGQLSDAACYSFYATKNLTCGEGGALATTNQELAQTIRRLSLHGMDKNASERYHGFYRHWDMLQMGWKCNLDDIHAALLVDQINRLDSLWARRSDLFMLYEREFFDSSVLRPSVIGKSAHHLYTIWVKPNMRDNILLELQARGIGVAVNYRAIHLLSHFRDMFKYPAGCFPNAEYISDRTITLPLYPSMSNENVNYVASQVKELVS